MMDAVRIRVGFAKHPKTLRLLARLGYTGGFCLVSLLAWAAEHHPTGDLTGIDDGAIEDAAGWPGAEGVLISGLLDARFLVGLPGLRKVHDFEAHNPISVMGTTTKRKREVAPVDAIVELYHHELPKHPRVLKVTPFRKRAIQRRWEDDLPGLEDWRGYFQAVSSSDFLTGRVEPKPGDHRKPFVADLDFLLRPETPTVIAEGKYHR